jgi:hypothetical protein
MWVRVLGLGLVALLVACPPPVVCPGGLNAPVMVTLQDGGESFKEPAIVNYSLDEAPSIACVADEETPGVYGCGRDLPGDYSISVAVDGRQGATESTAVGVRDCGLEGQELVMQIGDPCDTEDVVSVHVVVQDIDEVAIDGPIVKFLPVTEPGPMNLCEENELDDGFDCGVNIAGEIRISAMKMGYVGAEKNVLVQDEACSVLTEELVLVLVLKLDD